jgi:hypothetical protein
VTPRGPSNNNTTAAIARLASARPLTTVTAARLVKMRTFVVTLARIGTIDGGRVEASSCAAAVHIN